MTFLEIVQKALVGKQITYVDCPGCHSEKTYTGLVTKVDCDADWDGEYFMVTLEGGEKFSPGLGEAWSVKP